MNKSKKYKKQNAIIIILFSIISLVFLSTIAYSAFSSTMNITGIAHARVEANVRITDFRIASTTNATSSYEEFGKDHINSSINLTSSSSTITYYLEITNYGSTDVGIYNITGLPTGVNYQIKDYNLKDKICDESNKCNSFIKATYELVISTVNTSFIGDIKINFEFKPFHKITYVDFKNSYPSEVFDGDSITIDLSPDNLKFVEVESDNAINHTYNNKKLTLNKVTSSVIIKAISELSIYEYTGNYQTFTAPIDGTYKIELWGAAGGCDMVQGIIYDNNSGLGGYTSGNIYLTKNTNLYLYVGGKGSDAVLHDMAIGGYNGGGAGSHDFHDNEASGAGGGATDVRLVSGIWNSDLSLKSRIMVAAGGASEKMTDIPLKYIVSPPYTAGGGLIGYTMLSTSPPGTQTTGYAFGIGQDGIGGSPDIADGGGDSGLGGGGGGYYGGTIVNTDYVDSGSGGSSFISGHNGCVAIASSTSLTPRNDSNGNKCDDGTKDIECSYHYSGYKFNNTTMIDGAGYNWTTEKGTEVIGMPTFDGTSTMTGNTGNGYAKITLIKREREHQIRYTDIAGTYQNFVEHGTSLTVNFGNSAPTSITVLFDNKKTTNYTYDKGILNIPNVSNEVEIVGHYTFNYNYTGDSQIFTVPVNGKYKIELWGAGGGHDMVQGITYNNNSGLGGYTSGEISLNANEKLYVYVGGRGTDPAVGVNSPGGYNGGGQGSHDYSDNEASGGGGGATDIRLVSGIWNNDSSLKSRIMVAAGGASEKMYDIPLAYIVSPPYTAGGGLIGYTMLSTSPPGTQTAGYAFGVGQDGVGGSSDQADGGGNSGLGGGGGGYYGGTIVNTDYVDSGSGGSSFISGHNGCVAISSSTSLTPRNDSNGNKCTDGTKDIECSYHYSGYKFNNTTMIDGAGYNWTTEKGTEVIGMPTFDGTSTMTGNNGNGYAKITLINTN